MKEITMTNLKTELKNWIEEKFSLIPDYGLPFFSLGGWEGWLQVEFAMHLTNNGYDVIRESRIYGNTRYRADLVLNETLNKNRIIGVEIKCQSIYLQPVDIIKMIEEDYNKLRTLGNVWNGLIIVAVISKELFDILQKDGYECYINSHGNMALCFKSVTPLI